MVTLWHLNDPLDAAKEQEMSERILTSTASLK
jgi:hypothetical protein